MSPSPSEPRGWHRRGYLPHYDGGELAQSITIRLEDAVPRHCIERWQDERRAKPEAEREAELYRLIETYLDMGYGACYLANPNVAALVEDAFLFFAGTRYNVHAWVVMPNHAHALFTPRNGYSLSTIMHSWKSYTSNKANRLLNREGTFWQADYFDRFIRSADHFEQVARYIENNPVKAGLCRNPQEWAHSSA